LKTLSDELEQELGYYVKLFLIMYADDPALLAESASNLQNMLNLLTTLGIRIFFLEKKHNPPPPSWKLNGPSLTC
jgi:hypothetical protein